MRLSKWGYRADFLVYPALISLLGWRSGFATLPQTAAHFGAASAVGLFTWTVLEYALHRGVLHHLPPFKALHAAHHAHPGALIGTPTWLSVALFAGLWATVRAGLPAPLADGIVAGLMAGYLAYALIHDAVHHRRARPGSWLHGAKLRHARHHRPGPASDFGVSTGVWDRVFATASPEESGAEGHQRVVTRP